MVFIIIFYNDYIFILAMDESMSQYSAGTQNMSQKYMGVFKKEYQAFGKSLDNLATSFSLHETEQNRLLTTAIDETGKTVKTFVWTR